MSRSPRPPHAVVVSHAVPAATVVLVREAAGSSSGPEMFLVRRPHTGAFAGAHVFPGGRVDPGDAEPTWPEHCNGWPGLVARVAGRVDRQGALTHAVAAVREVFEETGLLLARTVLSPTDVARGQALLNAGQSDFLRWCRTHEVRLSLDTLHPWAHWITPDHEVRRFDTWFFIAAVNAASPLSIATGEVVDGAWMTPREALSANRQRTVRLPPPTLRTIEELSRYSTVGEAITAAARRPLTPVLPRLLPSAQQVTLVLPGDHAYGEAMTPGVDGPTRFVLEHERWSSLSRDDNDEWPGSAGPPGRLV